MVSIVLLMALALGAKGPEGNALVRARELYNLHQYDAAIQAAEEARRVSAGALDEATLILGRAYLERYRVGQSPTDLADARGALMRVDPSKLMPRDGVELVIGLGETLYFDGQFGAAAELFDGALAAPIALESDRDFLLDWWADSLERYAAAGPSREAVYTRMLRRMEDESQRNLRSIAASYWLVVAAHGVGDLERAWNAAVAAWVKAVHGSPRAATLRVDLDRYVSEIIIPERARQTPPGEEAARTEALRAEWESMKQQWELQ
jgi:tetratricopeptide (TPR) repeat protein